MSAAPLDRAVAARAARWFLLCAAGEANARELRALAAWRQADPRHEQAWQRAQQVSRTAGLVPAGIGQAVLCRPAPAAPDRRKAIKALLVLMTATPVGWAVVQAAPWRRWTADYATGTGEQRTVHLPDGTEVVLDTATAIALDFNTRQRRLLLRHGAIMVRTAPDPQARPFSVITADGVLTPIGTRFGVRQQPHHTDVTVLAGAVRVQPRDGASAQVLGAGRTTHFSTTTIAPPQPAPAAASLWVRGIVAADNVRLDQLLAELGRYRSGIVDCDPAVAGLRVTGGFQARDIDGALAQIAAMLALRLRYRTRYWVTLVPVPKNN